MDIPSELSEIFTNGHFSNYPKVRVPQSFIDGRGSIQNIADGKLGDVAVITSKTNSIRANHIHENDWHLSYLISGSMNYHWLSNKYGSIEESISVDAGEMIYTPSKTPHKMVFKEDSIFIAISALSRVQENYEADTKKLPNNFFT